MPFGVSMAHFTHISHTFHPRRSIIDYQDGSRGRAIGLLRMVSYLESLLSSKGQIYYLQAKRCRQILTCGWDITTSGLDKQMSAILEFHFRIRFQSCRRWRHFTTHWSTKFYPNQTIVGGVMMSYGFSRWRPLWRNFTSGFGLGRAKLGRRDSIHGWDIIMSVWKKTTNVRHIVILFPVSI